MAVYDYDIAVIGGGAAGLTVTAGAAQAGAKTLFMDRDRPWAEIACITAACPARP